MALDYHAMSTASNRGTFQGTTDIVASTDRRDVSEMLDLLALSDTPFINKIGWASESGSVSIEWISEDLGPGYVTAGSVKATGATSLQISTTEGLTTAEAARQLQTGTVLYHYSGQGEHGLMLLISVGSDGECEIEVLSTATTFSVDTSTTAGDKLFILGATANEGSLPRTGNWRSRVLNSNGFSLLRQDVQITGSQNANDMYAIGNEKNHQILMRMKELQRERERQALYGVHITPRATAEASMMNGALGFLYGQTGSNIDKTTTSLTESDVNTVVSSCWESGGKNLTFFGNLDQTAKFTRWDKNRIRMGIEERKGGGLITKYLCECGLELEIVPMKKVPGNIAFILDTSKIALRAKKGRKGFMQKLGVAGDFEDWQIISEFSMEMKGYNLHQHGLFTALA